MGTSFSGYVLAELRLDLRTAFDPASRSPPKHNAIPLELITFSFLVISFYKAPHPRLILSHYAPTYFPASSNRSRRHVRPQFSVVYGISPLPTNDGGRPNSVHGAPHGDLSSN
jgi:hypothetical protein